MSSMSALYLRRPLSALFAGESATDMAAELFGKLAVAPRVVGKG